MYFIYKKLKKSNSSKCLFCDDFSIQGEGLCEICYYRYIIKKKKNKDLEQNKNT